MTATCKNGVGIGTGQTTGQWPEIRKDTTITINDHAKVDAFGSMGIGSGTNGNQANYPLSGSIIIKDDAKVEYARGWNAIGFIDDYKYKTATSELKILGNATLEDLQGYYNGIGANNVTIGDDTGKVTIKNLESSQYYYGPLIRANESLTIASNADITLTQPTQERNTTFIKAGVDADGNSIYLTKADLEKIIGEDGTGKITYRIKDKTTGEYTLQYVVHGKDGCIWVLDEDQSVASTCTTKGKVVYVCKLEDGAVNAACHYGDDGTNTRTIELELAEHTWDDGVITTDPTCTTAGEKTYTCAVCNGTKTEAVDALGHDYGEEWDEVTPATCTTAGEVTYTCAACGGTKTETVKPLGHDFANGSWKTVKEATCLEEGLQEKQCSRCDTLDENETQTIEPIGHDWGEWTTAKEATCTVDGEQERVCKNDPAHKETEVIKVTGHQHLTEGVDKKNPTCEEPGYTGDTVCDTCGKVLESGTVLPTTGSNDSNVACELRVVVPGSTTRELWFTVRQSGGERTYTCKQDNATLTGSLETLQYLQSQGADTIVFVTNGRVSRFAVADLLALCNEGDVFYLCHTADAEPTLLIIANDHTELLNS